jgi:hypothetical protein
MPLLAPSAADGWRLRIGSVFWGAMARAAALIGSLLLVVAMAAAGEAPWPPVPGEARTMLLFTGADMGFVAPKACFHGAGGGLWRQPLDAWLDARRPELERFWISTGNVLYEDESEPMLSPPAVCLDHLRQVGYATLGVGRYDLDAGGAAWLRATAAEAGLPLVATNLLVHETGRPYAAPSQLLVTGGARVLLLSVMPHRTSWIWGGPEVGSVVTVPPLEAVRAEIARRAEESDVVVLLSTLGGPELRRLLEAVPQVDLVVAAAGHHVRPEPEDVAGRPVLWIGTWGQYLGRVVFSASGEVLGLRLIGTADGLPVDPVSGGLPAPSASQTSR